MEFNATDLKVGHNVYARDLGHQRDPQVALSFGSGANKVTIDGTLSEVRDAVRQLAATLGMIATVPQRGDLITARTPEVNGRQQVQGLVMRGGLPTRSLATVFTEDASRSAVVGLETAELITRAAPKKNGG